VRGAARRRSACSTGGPQASAVAAGALCALAARMEGPGRRWKLLGFAAEAAEPKILAFWGLRGPRVPTRPPEARRTPCGANTAPAGHSSAGRAQPMRVGRTGYFSGGVRAGGGRRVAALGDGRSGCRLRSRSRRSRTPVYSMPRGAERPLHRARTDARTGRGHRRDRRRRSDVPRRSLQVCPKRLCGGPRPGRGASKVIRP
jgi:hypothetical protein